MPRLVHTAKEAPIGWPVFDPPERRNAISSAQWQATPSLPAGFDDDPDVRVAILRGDGDAAFGPGADISGSGHTRTGAQTAQGAFLAKPEPVFHGR